MWEFPHVYATRAAVDSGDFFELGMFCEAMHTDGQIDGTLHTRSAGMLALPVMFKGDPFLCDQLGGKDAVIDETTGEVVREKIRREWDRILPNKHLASIIQDGILTGVALGVLDDDPTPGGWRTLRHLDIRFLQYQHSTEEWFYQDATRRLKVTPGDGNWFMFMPYGTSRPWTRGAWNSCAVPFVSRHGSTIDRARWSKFLADGLRCIELSENASERHVAAIQDGFFNRGGWSNSPGIVLPKGYTARIVESTGKGFEVYCDLEDRASRDIALALTGQVVTTDGGKGFSSGDIWRDVALSLTQAVAASLSEAIDAQILDPWSQWLLGVSGKVQCEYDLRDPSKKIEEAAFQKSLLENAKTLMDLATASGEKVSLKAFLKKSGMDVEFVDMTPVQPATPAQGQPSMPGAPVVDEEPSEDAAASLAAKMTEHGVDRCEHGSLNRCRMCGIERQRDFTPDPNGNHAWTIAWKPISKIA